MTHFYPSFTAAININVEVSKSNISLYTGAIYKDMKLPVRYVFDELLKLSVILLLIHYLELLYWRLKLYILFCYDIIMNLMKQAFYGCFSKTTSR